MNARTNTLIGLVPAGGDGGRLQTNFYAVSSSEATAIRPGDALVYTSLKTVKAADATAHELVGVSAGFVTAGEGTTTTPSLPVYDSPEQIYVIQDTTSGTLATTDVGSNFRLCTTSTGTGTSPILSKHALSGATASHDTILPLHVIAQHPIEGGSYVSGSPRKYFARINNHAHGHGEGRPFGVIDVREFGAVGDGVADDTAAVQAALDAVTVGNRAVYIPSGTYNLSTELTYNVDIKGSLTLFGSGASSILQLTGAANKGLHITGTPGATIARTRLRDFHIVSATTGSSAAGIHLDGLANVWISGVTIHGASKMDIGILLSGSQQGKISAGRLESTTTGIHFAASGGIHSDSIEVHGMTFASNTTSLKYSASQHGSVHSNHFGGSTTHIDFNPVGSLGLHNITGNHFESYTTAIALGANGRTRIAGNVFYGAGTDVSTTTTTGAVLDGNLLGGNVTFGAGSSQIIFINNLTAGVVTDNSTAIVAYGNLTLGGTPLSAAFLKSKLTLNSQESVAGDILVAKANGAVGGAWGLTVVGAGVDEEIYLRFNPGGPVIEGRTAGGVVDILSAVGGTRWARFQSGALQLYPFGIGAGQTGELRLLELVANGTNYQALKALDALSSNITFSLPTATTSYSNPNIYGAIYVGTGGALYVSTG